MSTRPGWSTTYITGAGSGIGLRLAERLRDRGAAVAGLDLEFGSEAERRLAAGPGPAASLHRVDVRDSGAVEAAVAAAAEAIGPPALAIGSAGIQLSRRFEELGADEFERVVDVNLLGNRNFAAAALARMQAGGQLALVASLAGIVPNYGYAAYSASKFGVVGLAGVLRLEYAPRAITVSVICPPEVETPMVDEERRSGDPVGLELKQFSGTLGVDRACDQILRGLEARRSMIVPGRRARLTRRLTQILPGLMNRAGDRMVARALRRQR